MVIPNVMGMCIYSPRLDRSRNSVRGVQFCKLFTDRFVFHQFDPSDRSRNKVDPRRKDFNETKVPEFEVKDYLQFRIIREFSFTNLRLLAARTNNICNSDLKI